MTMESFIGEHMARSIGGCGGWSGFHAADPELHIPGNCGTVGSTFPISVGLGLACQKKGKGDVVVCIFGDGACARGTMHESFNMASLMKLPIVWVCLNNGIALYAPFDTQFMVKDIADFAYSYGMPGAVVDGQDVVAVAEATMTAVERARAGEGPS
jgi:pyruvate dehydrogenase E1 component alpha subunit